HWGDQTDFRGSFLVFLRSLDPVREEIAQGRAVPLGCVSGTAVFFRDLPEPVSRRLHDAGEGLGCLFHYVPDATQPGTPTAAELGLFEYGHLCENWSAGPYGREQVPAQPLHVDQLPPTLRRELLCVRFAGLSFAETPHVQPLNFMECHTWVRHDA